MIWATKAPAFVALLDACVLYPAPLRDLLMELPCTGLFRAVWTERIHDEWISNLAMNRPDLGRDRLRRTADAMNEAVEDCLVEGYEQLIEALHLPDKGDRHVLAAAIVGRAGIIVTANLDDFPPGALAPYGIEAQHPDMFVAHLLQFNSEALGAIRICRGRLRKPPKTLDEYLDTLLRQGLPETVAYLRRWASLI